LGRFLLLRLPGYHNILTALDFFFVLPFYIPRDNDQLYSQRTFSVLIVNYTRSEMDPASLTRGGTCHLLRLLPELRNHIFDDALPTSSGVVCKTIRYHGNVLYRLHELKDLDMLLVDQVQYHTDSKHFAATELNQLK
jgi:hypothetical protein